MKDQKIIIKNVIDYFKTLIVCKEKSAANSNKITNWSAIIYICN